MRRREVEADAGVRRPRREVEADAGVRPDVTPLQRREVEAAVDGCAQTKEQMTREPA